MHDFVQISLSVAYCFNGERGEEGLDTPERFCAAKRPDILQSPTADAKDLLG